MNLFNLKCTLYSDNITNWQQVLVCLFTLKKTNKQQKLLLEMELIEVLIY